MPILRSVSDVHWAHVNAYRNTYSIIHTWKIANGEAPNDIDMSFKETLTHGIKAIVQCINYRLSDQWQHITKTHLE